MNPGAAPSGKAYKKSVRRALGNDFQRRSLRNFALSYKRNREEIFADMDLPAAIAELADRRGRAVQNHDRLLEQFLDQARNLGIIVHQAPDATAARQTILDIARSHGCSKIVKSKSMTSEEIFLNPFLEAAGLEVTETDLGEWILQLRGEGPSHMVMPAIHLSRGQVASTFNAKLDHSKADPEDIEALVRQARHSLRRKFAEADLGLTGANFILAENGTIGLVTNEGNARLVSSLPDVFVVLAGQDKLVESVEDALAALRVLPRNATGQNLTSYVSWLRGPSHPSQAMHVVLLDNGRSRLAADPIFSQALRCVRCGACANVCPVYGMIGGHQFGQVYIGAIGMVLTWFFHDRKRAASLIQNCLQCGSCKSVCPAGIDLPLLTRELRKLAAKEEGKLAPALISGAVGGVLRHKGLFHGLLNFGSKVQRPVTGDSTFMERLPHFLLGRHGFRALPALAAKPFRKRRADLQAAEPKGRGTVLLFGGCLQDFFYPEQLEAAGRVFAALGLDLEYPQNQSCCGLPLGMLGNEDAARDLARQNLQAFDQAEDSLAVVTLCASCAAYLKDEYPRLLGGEAEAFSAKVTDFSSFVASQTGQAPELAALFERLDLQTAYHLSCHQNRSLHGGPAGRVLLALASDYQPGPEEEACCGFGGTYTAKFPEISAQLLRNKLDSLEENPGQVVVTDCPGCILQLAGGLHKRGSTKQVLHMAQVLDFALAESLSRENQD